MILECALLKVESVGGWMEGKRGGDGGRTWPKDEKILTGVKVRK